MKVTKSLTTIAQPKKFEAAMVEEKLMAALQSQGLQGFPAELDIAERTEEHVQFISLEAFLGFAKTSGVAAVTYDITYFPHADEDEVMRQLHELGEVLDLSPDVIREVCSDTIQEYLKIDAQRDIDVPVHNIVECYVGGSAFAWYGVNDYPKLRRFILRKLAQGGPTAKRDFIARASRAQAELEEIPYGADFR